MSADAPQPTRKHIEEMEKLRAANAQQTVTGCLLLVPVLLKNFTICFVALCCFGGLWALAGRETVINAAVQGFVDLSLNKHLEKIIMAVLTALWLKQRSANRKLVKEAKRSSDLEKLLDPGRTGSTLTETGEVPKGGKP